jgi:hypothetical protein
MAGGAVSVLSRTAVREFAGDPVVSAEITAALQAIRRFG